MNRTFPALAAAALIASGCAYLGPPLPPLANVPGHITDLAAIQRDARVIAQFTPPALTTEGVAIKKPLTFDLRIGPAAAPFNIAEWSEQARHESSVPAVKGRVRYEIPSPEWTGKEVVIAVRAHRRKRQGVGRGRTPSSCRWSRLRKFLRLCARRLQPEACAWSGLARVAVSESCGASQAARSSIRWRP